MGIRLGRILAVSSLVLCLVFAIGCGNKPAGRSNLGTKIGDREVKASVEGAGFISSQGDSAEISCSAGKVVIEKGTVRLDGAELAKVPEDAKLVEVDYTAGKLTVTADGKPVTSKETRK